jgi:hypothetical protein
MLLSDCSLCKRTILLVRGRGCVAMLCSMLHLRGTPFESKQESDHVATRASTTASLQGAQRHLFLMMH